MFNVTVILEYNGNFRCVVFHNLYFKGLFLGIILPRVLSLFILFVFTNIK